LLTTIKGCIIAIPKGLLLGMLALILERLLALNMEREPVNTTQNDKEDS